MKIFLCLLVALPAMSTAAVCRRLHRSPVLEDYYEDFSDDPSYLERIPKRLPCYSRRSQVPARSYYDASSYPIYDTSAYTSAGSLNYQPAVVSKGLGGTICGPLGTTIRGQIGCGGLSGSVVTPLGGAISGSIGSVVQPAEPCRNCAQHDFSSVHYL